MLRVSYLFEVAPQALTDGPLGRACRKARPGETERRRPPGASARGGRVLSPRHSLAYWPCRPAAVWCEGDC